MIRNEFEDNQMYKTVESSWPPMLSSLRDKGKFRGSGFNNSNDESQHWDTFNAEHNNSIRDLQPLDSISLNKNIIKNLEVSFSIFTDANLIKKCKEVRNEIIGLVNSPNIILVR